MSKADVFIRIYGKDVGRMSHTVIEDNKNTGHLMDGRPVIKEIEAWYYEPR